MYKIKNAIVMVLAVQLIYSIIIFGFGKGLIHQIDVLRSPILILKLEFISDLAARRDFGGVLASNITILYHYIIFSLACFYATFLIKFRNVTYKPFGRSTWDRSTRYIDRDFKQLKHIIKIALSNNDKSFEYSDIAPKNTVRIDRAQIKGCPVPITGCEKLTIAGLEMIAAHPTCPAAVSGHHGGRTLMYHTNTVISEFSRLTNNSKYAAPLAVFHDIGKLITYELKTTKIRIHHKYSSWDSLIFKYFPNSKRSINTLKPKYNIEKYWSKKTNNHEAVGITILLNTPEYWDLPKKDKNIIASVLRYKGGRLPINLEDTDIIKQLIINLRIADGQALQMDVEQGYKSMHKSTFNFNSVIDALVLDAIYELNIHNYKRKKHHSGWTMNNEPNLYFLVSAIQVIISQNAGEDIRNTLALDVPYAKNVYSPFRTMLVESLNRQKILVQKVGEVEANQGIFNAKIGLTPFNEVIALNKASVTAKANTELPAWGESPYKIEILKNTSTWKEADLTDSIDTEESLIAGIRALNPNT